MRTENIEVTFKIPIPYDEQFFKWYVWQGRKWNV